MTICTIQPGDLAGIFHIAILVFNGLLAIPAIYHVSCRILQCNTDRTRSLTSKPYVDSDGIASAQAFRNTQAHPAKFFALAATFIGFTINFVDLVASSESAMPVSVERWLVLCSWSLLLIHTTNIVLITALRKRFIYALSVGAVSAALCVNYAIRIMLCHEREQRVIIDIVQGCAAVVICIACLYVPRRPKLEFCDSEVDGQDTVSALRRYTFAWCSSTLKAACSVKDFDTHHLPMLGLRLRSEYLESSSRQKRKQSSLTMSLLQSHSPDLILQSIFVTILSVFRLAPQAVMYVLVSSLEARGSASQESENTWLLVLALGLTVFFSSWGEVWNEWLSFSRLSLPLRTELTTMICSKVLKCKDTCMMDDPNNDFGLDRVLGEENLQPSSAYEQPKNPGSPRSPHGNRQAIINLVGIDAKRVANVAQYWSMLPAAIIELIVGTYFLHKLLGWKSLLAGFAMILIVMPFNVLASSRLTNAQTEIMNIRDAKLGVMTEVLQGIRQIKFSATESQWQDKINHTRGLELRCQWRIFLWDSCIVTFWIAGPTMMTAASLSVYSRLHEVLTPSVVFTSIAIFALLESTIAAIPELISNGVEAYISLTRIERFLDLPERASYSSEDSTISFRDATVSWPSDQATQSISGFALTGLDFTFPSKGFSVVSGHTGSGKSLILATLVGEANIVSGELRSPQLPSFDEIYDAHAKASEWILESSVAYVAQIPWIEDTTIRENILFGLSFQPTRYLETLQACALCEDLKDLLHGDQTSLGVNGVNLSVGQKWRISLARALYSRAGILILDDIFSAVDAKVRTHLFEEALTGSLGSGRTRIIATHHADLVHSRADFAIILAGGGVQYAGPISTLLESSTRDISPASAGQHGLSKVGRDHRDSSGDSLSSSTTSSLTDSYERDNKTAELFTQREEREYGAVKLKVYRTYMEWGGGYSLWIWILALFGIFQVVVFMRSYTFREWTQSYQTRKQMLKYPELTMLFVDISAHTLSRYHSTTIGFWICLVMSLSILICVMAMIRYLYIYSASISASTKLFDEMLSAVLHAHMGWLDTVPVGRILNRMTADLDTIDSDLASSTAYFLYEFCIIIGIIAAGSIVSPWMLLAASLLLMICTRITESYLCGARTIKRLDSNARSPVYDQLSSILMGLTTIRAYGRSEEYVRRLFAKLDLFTRTSWYYFLLQRWLIWRLDLIGIAFAITVACMIVALDIKASAAGFALAFALQYSTALVQLADQYANTELSMNAVERVLEYCDITGESEPDIVATVSEAWPAKGHIEVHDLVVSYKEGAPPVLKGLTFTIEARQRIGVVGRTGAGKSTLVLALFRFLEAQSGNISIDGVDISTLSLSTLRSNLCIIPQDPVLFSGTVRSNLDPFNKYTDTDLQDTLARVHLNSVPTACHSSANPRKDLDDGLDISESMNRQSNSTSTLLTEDETMSGSYSREVTLSTIVSESGTNLSHGQRQLIILARSIISRPKILIMDEATSAVDMATDMLIQRSIRKEFQDITLIVIAHRISTVADFDQILAIKDGTAEEYDTPAQLWRLGQSRRKGLFWGLVEESGESNKIKQMMGLAEDEASA